jgi:hypothetical protein
MAQAHMAERIQHAFVCQDAIGKRDLVAGVGEIVGHGFSVLSELWMPPEQSGNARPCQAAGRAGKECLAKIV